MRRIGESFKTRRKDVLGIKKMVSISLASFSFPVNTLDEYLGKKFALYLLQCSLS